ncbi:MAG TPA: adenylate/guanylate cyclase domain-containing protein [Anaerolineales bacterium]|nr:adenylate/guanylate cyclase domain-containing protein [Anaerolineales bacterium]
MPPETTPEQEWHRFLNEGEAVSRSSRRFQAWLPSSPRCKLCAAPFKGWGGAVMHMMGRDQSRYNPRFCAKCDQFEHPGGAEVVLTMLFADVRGSTSLAERMNSIDFSRLINRFYVVATDVLVRTDALVDRLIGDEVIGLYIPGFAGPDHARRAIGAGSALLEATGHRSSDGPWLPVGIGIHTGRAFVGVVGGGEGTPRDFTALGDNVNITARLASHANPGEVLISEAAFTAAGLDLAHLEYRELELKGRGVPTGVRVLRA